MGVEAKTPAHHLGERGEVRNVRVKGNMGPWYGIGRFGRSRFIDPTYPQTGYGLNCCCCLLYTEGWIMNYFN